MNILGKIYCRMLIERVATALKVSWVMKDLLEEVLLCGVLCSYEGNQVLLTNNTSLVANPSGKFPMLVSELGCLKRRKLTINEGRTVNLDELIITNY